MLELNSKYSNYSIADGWMVWFSFNIPCANTSE